MLSSNNPLFEMCLLLSLAALHRAKSMQRSTDEAYLELAGKKGKTTIRDRLKEAYVSIIITLLSKFLQICKSERLIFLFSFLVQNALKKPSK